MPAYNKLTPRQNRLHMGRNEQDALREKLEKGEVRGWCTRCERVLTIEEIVGLGPMGRSRNRDEDLFHRGAFGHLVEIRHANTLDRDDEGARDDGGVSEGAKA